MTPLQFLLSKYSALSPLHDEIVGIIKSEYGTSEKCEQLLELIEPLVSTTVQEEVVRTILELLEKGVEYAISENDAVFISAKKKELRDEEEYDAMNAELMLKSIFINVAPDVIRNTLIQQHGNVEQTIDVLLGNLRQSTPVCRHFMTGSCFRSDCWFSHDPEALVCKFWLKGRCAKGQDCEFSHATKNIETESKKIEPQKIQIPTVPTITDFPALTPAKRQQVNFFGPTNLYSKTASQSPTQPTKIEKAHQQYTQSKAKIKVEAKWVSTGAAVNNSYLEYRGDAINAALERNKLYQRATQAYLSGNKAAAKALSLAAAKLNEQVLELHENAATRIFSQRNTTDEPIIDLHGLHPDEAIKFVQAGIRQWQNKKYKGTLTIITGTGHHSRRNAKVLPAVQEYLASKGWNPRQGTLQDGKGGMIVISL